MPKVIPLHGPYAGIVQELPFHAAETMLSQGQARLPEGDEGTPPLLVTAAEHGRAGTVVTTESDAGGEVVRGPEVRPAAAPDRVATRATDGRPAEPRRATPAPPATKTASKAGKASKSGR